MTMTFRINQFRVFEVDTVEDGCRVKVMCP